MEKKPKQIPQNKEAGASDKQAPQPKDGSKTSVRTYRSDLADILKSKDSSMAGMVMAEEKKRNKSFFKVATATKKNIALSITSILFIAVGLSSVFLLYFFKPSPLIKISDVVLKPIIYSEYQKELFLEKPSKLKISKLIQNEAADINIPLGSLIHLYFTQRKEITGNTTEAGKTLADIEQFMTLIDTRIPGALLRFIEPNFMFGFHSSAGNKPFLILKTRSFENTFPEMLKWEENIVEDLRTVFIEDNPVLSVSRLREGKYQFKDIVIKNKDARAILDGGGKILFIYAFADKNTIAITTNKTTLQEIFNRLTVSYRKR